MFRPGSVFKNVRNETRVESVQKIDILDSNVSLKKNLYPTFYHKILKFRFRLTISYHLQNADEMPEGEAAETIEVSKGTKSLRQKAKIVGRFRGFSKQHSGDGGSEDGSAPGSGVSDGTSGQKTGQETASPSASDAGLSPGASRKSSINPG